MATHDEVAHAWAHQTGRKQRGFRMFYDGPSIFSHGRHFEAARLITLPGWEQPVALITNAGYSVSTSKHMSKIRRAVSHLTKFTVPSLDVQNASAHKYNWDFYVKTAAQQADKASRAITSGPWQLRAMREAYDDANEYNRVFECGFPQAGPWLLTNVDIAAVEKRVADREARNAILAETANARARINQRIADRKAHKKLAAWLTGEDVHVDTSRPWCRVRDDVVETTWGAKVPLADAILLFQTAKRCRTNSMRLRAPGKAGDFEVHSITPRGLAVVGCHKIPWQVMKIAADKAGITI